MWVGLAASPVREALAVRAREQRRQSENRNIYFCAMMPSSLKLQEQRASSRRACLALSIGRILGVRRHALQAMSREECLQTGARMTFHLTVGVTRDEVDPAALFTSGSESKRPCRLQTQAGC